MQLNIPTPCHENWEGMSPTERGRFCASCQKEVHDFTNKPDLEVIHQVLSSGDHICGRIGNAQLQRINHQVLPQLAKRAAMLAMIGTAGLLFLTGTAMAQDGLQVKVTNQVQQEYIHVTGVVTAGDTKQAMAGANVSIFVNGLARYTAFTDTKGAFSIQLPRSERDTLALMVISNNPDKYDETIIDPLALNNQFWDITMDSKQSKMELPMITADASPQNEDILGPPPHECVGSSNKHLLRKSKRRFRRLERKYGAKVQVKQITGKVVDKVTGEPLPFAIIQILKDNIAITGGSTDMDGNFVIEPVGSFNSLFDVKVAAIGYETTVVNGYKNDSIIEMSVDTVKEKIVVSGNINIKGGLCIEKVDVSFDPPGTTTFTQDDIKYIIK